MSITSLGEPVVDARAVGWLPTAGPEVRRAWETCAQVAAAQVDGMVLFAGDRPLADVEVLAGAVGACEYALAVRLHAASVAGAVPFSAPGGVLRARGWSSGLSRRLARCGALVTRCPELAGAWAAGVVTSEHLDPVARLADGFTDVELRAIAAQLVPHWGSWPPGLIGRFVAAADRMLHPPTDPTPDEADAHASRSLSFAVTRHTVILAGELPRLEGELVMAAIDSVAERLRSTADHVPATARRADALVQLVNDAHAAQLLPSRAGLPVALTVTLDRTELGDPLWISGRGHLLTRAESRWACCDAAVTPVLVDRDGREVVGASVAAGDAGVAGARIAALAAAMFSTRMPLAVGRTQRTASAAQRRALSVRDGGCIIPGCDVPADACQTHHLVEWAEGGPTDLENCVLLCWAHHRQVDLGMWTITRGRPEQAMSPGPGAPPGTRWPGNRGAPFTITRVPKRGRLSRSGAPGAP
jgi:hypothetical protein